MATRRRLGTARSTTRSHRDKGEEEQEEEEGGVWRRSDDDGCCCHCCCLSPLSLFFLLMVVVVVREEGGGGACPCPCCWESEGPRCSRCRCLLSTSRGVQGSICLALVSHAWPHRHTDTHTEEADTLYTLSPITHRERKREKDNTYPTHAPQEQGLGGLPRHRQDGEAAGGGARVEWAE